MCRVYLSSSDGGQLSRPSLSEHVDTKSCITCDPRMAIAPKYAVQAFALLNESPATQV